MTYRGTVKNGVVVLDAEAALPEGIAVEVVPVVRRGRRLRGLPAFGLWRRRRELPDSAVAARRLRRRLERRNPHG
jgi:hypothetical protein